MISREAKPHKMITLDCTKSSSIKEVKYSKKEKALYVKYNNGGSYKYLDVSRTEFKELFNAESIGRWIIENIVQSDKMFVKYIEK